MFYLYVWRYLFRRSSSREWSLLETFMTTHSIHSIYIPLISQLVTITFPPSLSVFLSLCLFHSTFTFLPFLFGQKEEEDSCIFSFSPIIIIVVIIVTPDFTFQKWTTLILLYYTAGESYYGCTIIIICIPYNQPELSILTSIRIVCYNGECIYRG